MVSRVVGAIAIRDEWRSIEPDWPHRSDYSDDLKAIRNSPEAQAWLEELKIANERAKAECEARLDARQAEIEAEQAERDRERQAWIEYHGSNRLRRAALEGLEHEAIYRDERLAKERPGWAWEQATLGKARDARNPSDECFVVLDEARQTDPAAKLVWWQVEREEDDMPEYDDTPQSKFAWVGCACVAEFLGRQIVFGVPARFAIA